MLNQSQIGKRLQQIRKQCGIKPAEVANSIGLPREDLISMERGQRAVSVREIEKLAEFYWCEAGFFLSEHHELGKDDLPVFLHREFSKLKLTPTMKTALWQLFDLYAEVAFLQKTLNQTVNPELPHYTELRIDEAELEVKIQAMAPGLKPEYVEKLQAKCVAEGESVAKKERRRLGLENEPVRNVAKLIHEQGISVAAAKLPKKLRGLFVKHPDIGLVILVNQQDSLARKRFACLHELAHALFDRSGKTAMMTFLDVSEFKEMRANAFAEEFIMPKVDVSRQLKKITGGNPDLLRNTNMDSAHSVQNQSIPQEITDRTVAFLALHFGVDYEIVTKRLVGLKFIDSKKERDLKKARGNGRKHIRWQAISDPSEHLALSKISEGKPCDQLRRLACEALRRKKISRGRFIEIGNKTGADYCEMFELLNASDFGD